MYNACGLVFLDAQICDAADWDEGMDVGTETIEVAGKILSVDTDALEHKAVALQTIIGFAESLEEHFPIPHITQLMEATGQLLGSALTKDVSGTAQFDSDKHTFLCAELCMFL